jgi:hypothetical protein
LPEPERLADLCGDRSLPSEEQARVVVDPRDFLNAVKLNALERPKIMPGRDNGCVRV